MKKIDKKENGFIITTTLYTMVIIAVLLILYILYFLINGKLGYNYLSNNAKEKINSMSKVDTSKLNYLYADIISDDSFDEDSLKNALENFEIDINYTLPSSNSVGDYEYYLKKVASTNCGGEYNEFHGVYRNQMVFKSYKCSDFYKYNVSFYNILNGNTNMYNIDNGLIFGDSSSDDFDFRTSYFDDYNDSPYCSTNTCCYGCSGIKYTYYTIDFTIDETGKIKETDTFKKSSVGCKNCRSLKEYEMDGYNASHFMELDDMYYDYECTDTSKTNCFDKNYCDENSDDILCNNDEIKKELEEQFPKENRMSLYYDNGKVIFYNSADEPGRFLRWNQKDKYYFLFKKEVSTNEYVLRLDFAPKSLENTNYIDKYYFQYIKITKSDSYNFDSIDFSNENLSEFTPLIYVSIDSEIDDSKKIEIKNDLIKKFSTDQINFEIDDLDSAISDVLSKIKN